MTAPDLFTQDLCIRWIYRWRHMDRVYCFDSRSVMLGPYSGTWSELEQRIRAALLPDAKIIDACGRCGQPVVTSEMDDFCQQCRAA